MSVFDHLSLAEMYDEIRSVYQSMQREWMVAFSYQLALFDTIVID